MMTGETGLRTAFHRPVSAKEAWSCDRIIRTCAFNFQIFMIQSVITFMRLPLANSRPTAPKARDLNGLSLYSAALRQHQR